MSLLDLFPASPGTQQPVTSFGGLGQMEPIDFNVSAQALFAPAEAPKMGVKEWLADHSAVELFNRMMPFWSTGYGIFDALRTKKWADDVTEKGEESEYYDRLMARVSRDTRRGNMTGWATAINAASHSLPFVIEFGMGLGMLKGAAKGGTLLVLKNATTPAGLAQAQTSLTGMGLSKAAAGEAIEAAVRAGAAGNAAAFNTLAGKLSQVAKVSGRSGEQLAAQAIMEMGGGSRAGLRWLMATGQHRTGHALTQWLKKAPGATAGKVAGAMGVDAAMSVPLGLAMTATPVGMAYIARGTVEEMTDVYALDKDQQGRLGLALIQEGRNAGEALIRAATDTAIEFSSESLGEALIGLRVLGGRDWMEKAGAGLAKHSFGKKFTSLVKEGMPSDMARETAFDMIFGNAETAGKWAWHGIAMEILEEQAGTAARYFILGDGDKPYIGLEDSLWMGVGFAMSPMGLVSARGNRIQNAVDKNVKEVVSRFKAADIQAKVDAEATVAPRLFGMPVAVSELGDAPAVVAPLLEEMRLERQQKPDGYLDHLHDAVERGIGWLTGSGEAKRRTEQFYSALVNTELTGLLHQSKPITKEDVEMAMATALAGPGMVVMNTEAIDYLKKTGLYDKLEKRLENPSEGVSFVQATKELFEENPAEMSVFLAKHGKGLHIGKVNDLDTMVDAEGRLNWEMVQASMRDVQSHDINADPEFLNDVALAAGKVESATPEEVEVAVRRLALRSGDVPASAWFDPLGRVRHGVVLQAQETYRTMQAVHDANTTLLGSDHHVQAQIQMFAGQVYFTTSSFETARQLNGYKLTRDEFNNLQNTKDGKKILTVSAYNAQELLSGPGGIQIFVDPLFPAHAGFEDAGENILKRRLVNAMTFSGVDPVVANQLIRLLQSQTDEKILARMSDLLLVPGTEKIPASELNPSHLSVDAIPDFIMKSIKMHEGNFKSAPTHLLSSLDAPFQNSAYQLPSDLVDYLFSQERALETLVRNGAYKGVMGERRREAPAAPAEAQTPTTAPAEVTGEAPGSAADDFVETEAPKAEAPKAEAPKAEAPKAEAPKAEAPKAGTRKGLAQASRELFVRDLPSLKPGDTIRYYLDPMHTEEATATLPENFDTTTDPATREPTQEKKEFLPGNRMFRIQTEAGETLSIPISRYAGKGEAVAPKAETQEAPAEPQTDRQAARASARERREAFLSAYPDMQAGDRVLVLDNGQPREGTLTSDFDQYQAPSIGQKTYGRDYRETFRVEFSDKTKKSLQTSNLLAHSPRARARADEGKMGNARRYFQDFPSLREGSMVTFTFKGETRTAKLAPRFAFTQKGGQPRLLSEETGSFLVDIPGVGLRSIQSSHYLGKVEAPAGGVDQVVADLKKSTRRDRRADGSFALEGTPQAEDGGRSEREGVMRLMGMMGEKAGLPPDDNEEGTSREVSDGSPVAVYLDEANKIGDYEHPSYHRAVELMTHFFFERGHILGEKAWAEFLVAAEAGSPGVTQRIERYLETVKSSGEASNPRAELPALMNTEAGKFFRDLAFNQPREGTYADLAGKIYDQLWSRAVDTEASLRTHEGVDAAQANHLLGTERAFIYSLLQMYNDTRAEENISRVETRARESITKREPGIAEAELAARVQTQVDFALDKADVEFVGTLQRLVNLNSKVIYPVDILLVEDAIGFLRTGQSPEIRVVTSNRLNLIDQWRNVLQDTFARLGPSGRRQFVKSLVSASYMNPSIGDYDRQATSVKAVFDKYLNTGVPFSSLFSQQLNGRPLVSLRTLDWRDLGQKLLERGEISSADVYEMLTGEKRLAGMEGKLPLLNSVRSNLHLTSTALVPTYDSPSGVKTSAFFSPFVQAGINRAAAAMKLPENLRRDLAQIFGLYGGVASSKEMTPGLDPGQISGEAENAAVAKAYEEQGRILLNPWGTKDKQLIVNLERLKGLPDTWRIIEGRVARFYDFLNNLSTETVLTAEALSKEIRGTVESAQRLLDSWAAAKQVDAQGRPTQEMISALRQYYHTAPASDASKVQVFMDIAISGHPLGFYDAKKNQILDVYMKRGDQTNTGVTPVPGGAREAFIEIKDPRLIAALDGQTIMFNRMTGRLSWSLFGILPRSNSRSEVDPRILSMKGIIRAVVDNLPYLQKDHYFNFHAAEAIQQLFERAEGMPESLVTDMNTHEWMTDFYRQLAAFEAAHPDVDLVTFTKPGGSDNIKLGWHQTPGVDSLNHPELISTRDWAEHEINVVQQLSKSVEDRHKREQEIFKQAEFNNFVTAGLDLGAPAGRFLRRYIGRSGQVRLQAEGMDNPTDAKVAGRVVKESLEGDSVYNTEARKEAMGALGMGAAYAPGIAERTIMELAKRVQSNIRPVARRESLLSASPRLAAGLFDTDDQTKGQYKFAWTSNAARSGRTADYFKGPNALEDFKRFLSTVFTTSGRPVWMSHIDLFSFDALETFLTEIAGADAIDRFMSGEGIAMEVLRGDADQTRYDAALQTLINTGLREWEFRTYAEVRAKLIEDGVPKENLAGLADPNDIDMPGEGLVIPGTFVQVNRIPADGQQSSPLLRHFVMLREDSQMSITPQSIMTRKGEDLDGDAAYLTMMDLDRGRLAVSAHNLAMLAQAQMADLYPEYLNINVDTLKKVYLDLADYLDFSAEIGDVFLDDASYKNESDRRNAYKKGLGMAALLNAAIPMMAELRTEFSDVSSPLTGETHGALPTDLPTLMMVKTMVGAGAVNIFVDAKNDTGVFKLGLTPSTINIFLASMTRAWRGWAEGTGPMDPAMHKKFQDVAGTLLTRMNTQEVWREFREFAAPYEHTDGLGRATMGSAVREVLNRAAKYGWSEEQTRSALRGAKPDPSSFIDQVLTAPTLTKERYAQAMDIYDRSQLANQMLEQSILAGVLSGSFDTNTIGAVVKARDALNKADTASPLMAAVPTIQASLESILEKHPLVAYAEGQLILYDAAVAAGMDANRKSEPTLVELLSRASRPVSPGSSLTFLDKAAAFHESRHYLRRLAAIAEKDGVGIPGFSTNRKVLEEFHLAGMDQDNALVRQLSVQEIRGRAGEYRIKLNPEVVSAWISSQDNNFLVRMREAFAALPAADQLLLLRDSLVLDSGLFSQKGLGLGRLVSGDLLTSLVTSDAADVKNPLFQETQNFAAFLEAGRIEATTAAAQTKAVVEMNPSELRETREALPEGGENRAAVEALLNSAEELQQKNVEVTAPTPPAGSYRHDPTFDNTEGEGKKGYVRFRTAGKEQSYSYMYGKPFTRTLNGQEYSFYLHPSRHKGQQGPWSITEASTGMRLPFGPHQARTQEVALETLDGLMAANPNFARVIAETPKLPSEVATEELQQKNVEVTATSDAAPPRDGTRFMSPGRDGQPVRVWFDADIDSFMAGIIGQSTPISDSVAEGYWKRRTVDEFLATGNAGTQLRIVVNPDGSGVAYGMDGAELGGISARAVEKYRGRGSFSLDAGYVTPQGELTMDRATGDGFLDGRPIRPAEVQGLLAGPRTALPESWITDIPRGIREFGEYRFDGDRWTRNGEEVTRDEARVAWADHKAETLPKLPNPVELRPLPAAFLNATLRTKLPEDSPFLRGTRIEKLATRLGPVFAPKETRNINEFSFAEVDASIDAVQRLVGSDAMAFPRDVAIELVTYLRDYGRMERPMAQMKLTFALANTRESLRTVNQMLGLTPDISGPRGVFNRYVRLIGDDDAVREELAKRAKNYEDLFNINTAELRNYLTGKKVRALTETEQDQLMEVSAILAHLLDGDYTPGMTTAEIIATARARGEYIPKGREVPRDIYDPVTKTVSKAVGTAFFENGKRVDLDSFREINFIVQTYLTDAERLAALNGKGYGEGMSYPARYAVLDAVAAKGHLDAVDDKVDVASAIEGFFSSPLYKELLAAGRKEEMFDYGKMLTEWRKLFDTDAFARKKADAEALGLGGLLNYRENYYPGIRGIGVLNSRMQEAMRRIEYDIERAAPSGRDVTWNALRVTDALFEVTSERRPIPDDLVRLVTRLDAGMGKKLAELQESGQTSHAEAMEWVERQFDRIKILAADNRYKLTPDHYTALYVLESSLREARSASARYRVWTNRLGTGERVTGNMRERFERNGTLPGELNPGRALLKYMDQVNATVANMGLLSVTATSVGFSGEPLLFFTPTDGTWDKHEAVLEQMLSNAERYLGVKMDRDLALTDRLGRMEKLLAANKDYASFESPAIGGVATRILYRKDDAGLAGMGPNTAAALKKMFGQKRKLIFGHLDLMSAWENLTQFTKFVNLAASPFFLFSAVESYAASLGPGGVPRYFKELVTGKAPNRKIKELSRQLRRGQYDEAYSYDLTQLRRNGFVLDIRLDPSVVNTGVAAKVREGFLAMEKYSESRLVRGMAKTVGTFLDLQLKFTEFMFQSAFPTLKTDAALRLVNEIKAQKPGGELSQEDYRSIARVMNDGFGGQRWLDYWWANPGTMQMWNLFMFAPNWCVTTNTQARCKDGWKSHHELKIGDEILIYDPESGTTRWGALQDKFFRADYEGDMVYIGGRNREVAVTPEHTCRVIKRHSGEEKTVKAHEITKSDSIPRVAPFGELPSVPTVSDRTVQLAGWFVTDGTISRTRQVLADGREKMYEYARVKQSKPDGVAALKALGLSFYTEPLKDTNFKANYQTHVFRFTPEGYQELQSLGLRGRSLSYEFLSKLTLPQLDLLYATMLKGNGTGQNRFCGTKEAVDMMVLLQTMRGKPVTFWEQAQEGASCWMTREIESPTIGCRNKRVEHFSGGIWCPSVETGFWVAQRDGMPFITGNTMSAANIAGAVEITSRLGLSERTTQLHRDVMLKRYWPAMAMYVVAGWPNVMQAIISLGARAMGGGDDEDELFTAMNERGKEFHIDITPLMRVFPWFRGGDNGDRRVYVRWGKQVWEVFDPQRSWLATPFKTAQGKLSTPVRTVIGQFTGAVPGSDGWDLDFKRMGVAGVFMGEKNGFAGSRIAHIASMFRPYSFSALTRMTEPDGMDAMPLSFFGATSRGVSRRALTQELVKVLSTYADAAAWDGIRARPETYQQLLALRSGVVEAAARNGYDGRQIAIDARKAVASRLYSEFAVALERGDEPRMQQLALSILRVQGGMNSLMKSLQTRARQGDADIGRYTPENIQMMRDAFAEAWGLPVEP